MEYAVILSFILIALIMGVQHLGAITSGLFQREANATDFSKKTGP